LRNPGLDLLRIFAVFLVLGRHLYVPSNAPQILFLWQRGGWVGVDLFFVLSGFLVSSLLFKEFQRDGAIQIKRFLIRRGLKIYPAFWAMLLFTLVTKLRRHDSIPLDQLLGEVFFLQNYVGKLWVHTWSLAVEEHFYIGLSLLFAWLIHTRKQAPFVQLPKIFMGIALICLGLRASNLYFHPVFSPDTYVFGTHLRIDSLFFGVFLSYLESYHKLSTRLAAIPTALLLGVGALCLSPAFVFPSESHRWVSIVGFDIFSLGSGLILFAALRLRDAKNVVVKLLSTLGAASYSIYLWHMPVQDWGTAAVQKLTGTSYLVYLVSYLLGSCLVGWGMNRLLEAPVLLLRDRLFPASPPKTP
jgi:peptidoglycan/LPS O-acetylase OafA/YrhL